MRNTPLILLVVWLGTVSGGPLPAAEPEPKLAQQAYTILEKTCYRCHGQNGANEGGVNYILDFGKLIARKKVVPRDPGKSKLYQRVTASADPMPPADEKPRPGEADLAVLRQWIEAGAPAPAAAAVKARPFKTDKDVQTAIRDHLRQAPRATRPYLRYFTLTHLHNLPGDKVRDDDLAVYRAALSKLVNSLSWKSDLVIPEAVDPEQTVLAVDLRRLDWDERHLWQELLKLYPYGLKHDHYPEDETGREVAREVYELAGTDLPAVRADWFVATASRPPLYHTLLQLPDDARELERRLKVDIPHNFRRGQLVRAGFTKSGVSGQNRLVERHAAVYGAYWKSYDFKSNDGRGNLFRFPLGPLFHDHPFERLAFDHDGGEIIFNLPNGLQGYLLVDGKDRRIDAGPIEVVSDGKKTSGTPAIVNGLSCMACHQHGMIREFTDTVRTGAGVAGSARDKVRELYVLPEEMNQLLQKDEDRFVRALDGAVAPFLKGDGSRDIRSLPEPISAIARWYLLQELGALEAAHELGEPDPKRLQAALEHNPQLQRLGLGPLTQGATIKRETWESLKGFISPFQEVARALKRGTPKRVQ
ncbi:MAG: hypothetical protein L0Z62_01425 [Gemmataceae bacterium]|nr:hypothetical protein [Gemmataceae bacterium]